MIRLPGDNVDQSRAGAPDEPAGQAPEADGEWDIGIDLAGDPAPRIEPGAYTARVVHAGIRTFYKKRRLVLTFEIVQSKAAGTRLQFICLLPPRASAHSSFTRAWQVANGAPPRRRDRMSLRVFRSRLFLVLVRDVTHDHRQRRHVRPYSVVDMILERVA